VLIKAIEDAALGVASVYRSIEVPLPTQLLYASKELRREWADLLARIMPFDLVIDEHTADGQEARVSKTSVAGSWGAVAGNLRFFADRFGVPRAGIEGTTLSYDLVREYAVLGLPKVAVSGPRKHEGLTVERRRTYFGFELDTIVEPIRGEIPDELRGAARDVLTAALMDGETSHPEQGRIRRGLEALDEWWRRSGGTLPAASPEALRKRIRAQLEPVDSWDRFLRTPLSLDPNALVDARTRERLDALPGMLRVRGDAAPVDYELINGQGVARVRLREGQAKRLRADELPLLDRPLHFAVQRGRHAPLLADSVLQLQALLRRSPKESWDGEDDRPRRGHRGGRRGGPPRRPGRHR
jgi:ATP-dependent helicase HrpA